MVLCDMTLKDFAEITSQDVAVPGGGSVAALSASLGASLIEMVGHMSVRKATKNKTPLDKDIKDGIKEAAKAKTQLIELIDKDAQSFDCVMAAFALPKNTDAEKEKRGKAIQKAYIGAMQPPLKVINIAFSLLKYGEAMVKKGDPNALSDAAVGVRMLNSGIWGAIYNVRINLAGIKDNNEVTRVATEMREMEKKTEEISRRILKDLIF